MAQQLHARSRRTWCRDLRGTAHTDWHLRWTQLAPRSVAQTGLQRASGHRVKLSIAPAAWRKSTILIVASHKRRYSVELHCSGCSKRTVGFASRQGTQVALLSGSLPEATISGCARAPGYQQLSRRLHWAAISIHGNCRACASGTHARHAMNASAVRVKPTRRRGRADTYLVLWQRSATICSGRSGRTLAGCA